MIIPIIMADTVIHLRTCPFWLPWSNPQHQHPNQNQHTRPLQRTALRRQKRKKTRLTPTLLLPIRTQRLKIQMNFDSPSKNAVI